MLSAGAKSDSWEQCHPSFVELLRKQNPDVLDDPERALASKPA